MEREDISMKKKQFSSQSSDKLLQIMECLAEYRVPAKLQDISSKLGIPQPTVLRYLNSLIQQNYAYKDEKTLSYAMTWKVCGISHSITSNNSIRDLASPFLRELSHRFNTGMALVIHDDGELLYIDVVDNPNTVLNSLQRIGKNAPMHATGSGKVLLASLTQQQVKDIAERKGLPKLMENTIDNVDALLRELENVRKQGYALDDEECEPNIRCVSVPLYDYTNNVVAGLSAFGSAQDFTHEYIYSLIVPTLKETASIISARLGN